MMRKEMRFTTNMKIAALKKIRKWIWRWRKIID